MIRSRTTAAHQFSHARAERKLGAQGNEPMKSPLKWPGGKLRQLDLIRGLLEPERMPATARYIEPFVGGGSIALNVGAPGPRLVLGDVSMRLVCFIRNVVTQTHDVVDRARALFDDNLACTREFYDEQRSAFNLMRPVTLADGSRLAATLLYLNRHGFNGLYRENSRGEYNVPFGDGKRPYFPEDELYHMAQAFAGALVMQQDGACVVQLAQPGDRVYCDPPFLPRAREGGGFSGYSSVFGVEQHRALAIACAAAAAKGVRVVISNHDSALAHEVYSSHYPWRVVRTDAHRAISRDGDRSSEAEVLFVGGP